MAKDLDSLYDKCSLCPHRCGVNRNKGEVGWCGQSNKMEVSWIGLHKGEEPLISGSKGSGMIFFYGCTLGCPWCQNYQISKKGYKGVKRTVYSPETLAAQILKLQAMGAHTISFVTPEHYIPSVIQTIQIAKEKGCKLPFVFNTSGWLTTASAELLSSYIDIFNWDYKAYSPDWAETALGNSKYPKEQQKALHHLLTVIVSKELDTEVIVRHLVLNGGMNDSRSVIKDVAHYRNIVKFSLMFQFIDPLDKSGKKNLEFPPITKNQYKELTNLVYDMGIENGYIQEFPDGNEKVWIPDFTKENPFPAGFATPLK